jgi:hypothetical protein
MLEAGETVDIYAPFKEGKEGFIYLFGVTLDKESFLQGYETLKANGLNVTEFDDTKIKGKINVAQDGVLYTSINYDTSWSVYIDGQKVPKADIISIGNDALLGVNITAGEHTIEFKYVPDGLMLGIMISVTTLLMMLLLCSIIKTGIFKFNPATYVEEVEENSETEDEEDGTASVLEEVTIDDTPPDATGTENDDSQTEE